MTFVIAAMKKLFIFIGALFVFFVLATTQAQASYWSSWGYPTAMGAYAYNSPYYGSYGNGYGYNYPYYGYYSYGSGYGAAIANNYFNNKNMYNFAEHTLDKTYSFVKEGNNYPYGFPSNGNDYNPGKQYTFYNYKYSQSPYYQNGWY